LINGLNNIDLEYAKTILDSIDEKAMANKKNSNQTVPDPIRLTYYSEWADVKSFVDCGDVHLGKVKDDAVRINCNIKRSMMDEHKMRAITVGIEVAPNDEKTIHSLPTGSVPSIQIMYPIPNMNPIYRLYSPQ